MKDKYFSKKIYKAGLEPKIINLAKKLPKFGIVSH